MFCCKLSGWRYRRVSVVGRQFVAAAVLAEGGGKEWSRASKRFYTSTEGKSSDDGIGEVAPSPLLQVVAGVSVRSGNCDYRHGLGTFTRLKFGKTAVATALSCNRRLEQETKSRRTLNRIHVEQYLAYRVDLSIQQVGVHESETTTLDTDRQNKETQFVREDMAWQSV